jgi:hypothetical protein
MSNFNRRWFGYGAAFGFRGLAYGLNVMAGALAPLGVLVWGLISSDHDLIVLGAVLSPISLFALWWAWENRRR